MSNSPTKLREAPLFAFPVFSISQPFHSRSPDFMSAIVLLTEMEQYNYGGSNPYDQRGDGGYDQGGYDNGGGYGQGGYSQGGYDQGGYGGGGGSGGSYSQGGGSDVEMSSGGHIAILNECRNIDGEIRELESRHQQLRTLHDKAAYEAGNEPDSRTNQEITAVLDEIRDTYHTLGDRLKNLATKPESQSPKCKPQVDRVKRSLKDSVQKFATLQSQLSREKDADVERQYRIVNGNPPESDVRRYMDGVRNGEEDPNQLFQQALMQSSRVEGANRKLSALKARNQALQQIERQMAELLELFTQMDTLVMQQDVNVAQIEQKAEEVVENLDKGNEEIGTAVKTAKATRRKKWWCLGICVLIIIIVVIIVVVYMAVNGKFSSGDSNNDSSSNAKRSVLTSHIRGGPPRLLTDRSRPISRIYGRNYVVPGETREEHIGSGSAFDISKRDGPIMEKLANAMGI
ncbi:Protein transport protein SSO2 [Zalerion maritima]|uniref:Protein transport protein SSO2 n=1 Tax=Zalerion maritima TaxID=339359 RepID=A0AAD5RGS0_9PEZI|nr:Protein transport protein SSO2 [Zalerion maritima]